jgi:predicted Zn-dependent protease
MRHISTLSGFLLLLAATVASATERDIEDLARLDRLLAAGRAETAAEQARGLLAGGGVHPRNVWRVQQRLAVALLELDRPAEAVPVLETALQSAPDDAALHLNLGRALRGLGRPGRALGEFEAAVMLAPDRYLWRLEFAEVMLELGIRRDALQQIHLARATCRDCPEALRAEATYHQRVGDPAGAVAALVRLHALQPAPEVRRLLASALWARGDAEAVVALLDTVAVARLSGAEVLILVQADRRLGNSERALAWVGQPPAAAADGWLPDADFWAIVSEICLGTGAGELALQAIDRAIALRPEAAVLHHNRAAVLVRLDREDEARQALGEAQRLDPSLKEAP